MAFLAHFPVPVVIIGGLVLYVLETLLVGIIAVAVTSSVSDEWNSGPFYFLVLTLLFGSLTNLGILIAMFMVFRLLEIGCGCCDCCDRFGIKTSTVRETTAILRNDELDDV
jgi:hypothetical protein